MIVYLVKNECLIVCQVPNSKQKHILQHGAALSLETKNKNKTDTESYLISIHQLSSNYSILSWSVDLLDFLFSVAWCKVGLGRALNRLFLAALDSQQMKMKSNYSDLFPNHRGPLAVGWCSEFYLLHWLLRPQALEVFILASLVRTFKKVIFICFIEGIPSSNFVIELLARSLDECLLKCVEKRKILRSQ